METTHSKGATLINYAKLAREVNRSKTLSDAAKVLYWYYMDRANGEGFCWPSNKTAADDLGWSERKLKKAKAELVKEKLIIATRRRMEDGNANSIRLTSRIDVYVPTSSTKDSESKGHYDAPGLGHYDARIIRPSSNNPHSPNNLTRQASVSPEAIEATNKLNDELVEWNGAVMGYKHVDESWTPNTRDYEAMEKFFEEVDDADFIFDNLDEVKKRFVKKVKKEGVVKPMHISYVLKTLGEF